VIQGENKNRLGDRIDDEAMVDVAGTSSWIATWDMRSGENR
jgi:hypothetical protein